jgi:hypothetical protein
LHRVLHEIFHHDYIKKNPLSLYLIDIIAKLEFYEKREIESFDSFEESKNKQWLDFHESTIKYSVNIKEEYIIHFKIVYYLINSR